MKRLFFFCAIIFFTGCASLPTDYVKLDNQETLSLDAVMEKISKERVIFIGEIHGTASIHLLQLEIIKRLRERGKELVIALEAFPDTRQGILNKWIAGSLDKGAFEQAYSAYWSIPFEYYEGIFDYAKEQHIPLVAMNAEDTIIREASKKGLQTVSADFLKKIQFTDCSTDPAYKGLVNSISIHASGFQFFCDGQRLRDTVMAFNISNAMAGNNYTVVVLAGVAHSSKMAVPRILENNTGATSTVLLPEEVKYFIKRTPDRNIADYIWY